GAAGPLRRTRQGRALRPAGSTGTEGSRNARGAGGRPGRARAPGRRRATASFARLREGAEPLQALGVGDRGVRRRGRGKDEEPRVAKPVVLDAELRALAKGAAIGLLADDRDPGR